MGQQGVTLIQMMYALGLIAALTQLGLPAYSAMSVSLQREASAQNLAQALRSARSEALLRNQRVSLTAFEGDWSKGWRMSADDEGLLHEYRASGKVQVVGNQPLARQVHFSGLGYRCRRAVRSRPGPCTCAKVPEPGACIRWCCHAPGGSACATSPPISRCARPPGQISERTRSSLGIENVTFSSRPSSSSAPVAPHSCNCAITPRTSTSGRRRRR